MERTRYEDYKYCMQDVNTVYVGAKYTMAELLADETIPFRLQLVVQRYILSEADREDSLETHLYYLEEKSFLVQIYKQLHAKVKVMCIDSRKSLTGKVRSEYMTKMLPVTELVKMTKEEKEARGFIIQELAINKLSLMTF